MLTFQRERIPQRKMAILRELSRLRERLREGILTYDHLEETRRRVAELSSECKKI